VTKTGKVTFMKNIFIGNTVKAILISSLFLVESCATVPLIGRKQLSLVPESTMLELSLTNYSDFLLFSSMGHPKFNLRFWNGL